ncbi:STAS-like domain-containing protein [Cylindrospermum sp. FACHB-282]|uniref:STAS-like domain-containing protein n=1 Tax=Cylindrospermum sp. FACHB-282 TaxID=2692794 RepID=UPI00168580AE|nr:STAS-like domain-containing protein [Cylindrospermum sp. FACHB-282]MBD2387345.1 STAS-like domain-containing protein [Cylindrospermum sp. FACHB-282]
MIYKIYELVGECAITADDGQKVYDQIHPQLLAGHPVELDFTGVKILATLFFNFAIGQLLKDISADNLNQLLKFPALSSHGVTILERVIPSAKRYYFDEQHRKAVDSVMADMAATI